MADVWGGMQEMRRLVGNTMFLPLIVRSPFFGLPLSCFHIFASHCQVSIFWPLNALSGLHFSASYCHVFTFLPLIVMFSHFCLSLSGLHFLASHCHFFIFWPLIARFPFFTSHCQVYIFWPLIARFSFLASHCKDVAMRGQKMKTW